MEGNSYLIITDGTVKVNLLDFNLTDWQPASAPWKDGGIWSSSPYADSQRLITRQFSPVIDTFSFDPTGFTQDVIIKDLLNLITLLEKAVAYQTSDWQNEPVWIEARGTSETNKRYALILGYTINGITNPYMLAFAEDTQDVIEEFSLILNHEIWGSHQPGDGDCIQVNSIQQADAYSSTHTDVDIVSELDNIFWWNSVSTKLTTVAAGLGFCMGFDTMLTYQNMLVFRDVPIERASRVSGAVLYVMASQASMGNGHVYVHVTGLSKRDQTVILSGIYTPQEIQNLPRTVAYVDEDLNGAWIDGNTYALYDLEPIIQEIVNDPDWESGDDLVLVIEDNGTASGQVKYYAPFQFGGGYAVPQLSLTYYNGTNHGKTATCDDEVFIINKHNRAQLTNIIVYDANLASYTHYNLDGATALPISLLPAVPAVGDKLYIGIKDTGAPYEKTGPFNNVIFDLHYPTASQSPSNITGMSYKYYDRVGVAFTALAAGAFYDETQMFNLAGVRGLYFKQPSTFGSVAVDGVTAYWICLEITAITGTARAVEQVNNYPYTDNTPYFDIPALSAGGDITAIAKTLLHGRFRDAAFYYNDFYLAVRSIARGNEFSPYLNASDADQHQPGLACTAGANTTFAQDSGSASTPFGFLARYDGPAGLEPLADEVLWDFAQTLAFQYSGRYAVYLRYYMPLGSIGDIFAALNITWGGFKSYITETFNLDPAQNILYMGDIDLSLSAAKGERFYNSKICLQLGSITNKSAFISDLILVPLDEFVVFVDIDGNWSLTGTDGDAVSVDSLGYPKVQTRVNYYHFSNQQLGRQIDFNTAQPWMQQSGHQRVWYFMLSLPDRIMSVQHWASNRYALGMRGSK